MDASHRHLVCILFISFNLLYLWLFRLHVHRKHPRHHQTDHDDSTSHTDEKAPNDNENDIKGKWRRRMAMTRRQWIWSMISLYYFFSLKKWFFSFFPIVSRFLIVLRRNNDTGWRWRRTVTTGIVYRMRMDPIHFKDVSFYFSFIINNLLYWRLFTGLCTLNIHDTTPEKSHRWKPTRNIGSISSSTHIYIFMFLISALLMIL